MNTAIVKMQGLSFSYNGHEVLRDVDFKIFPGDFIAMIGPNGGGKTTLLKLILGLLQPSTGFVRVLGLPPSKASHYIGYVPQEIPHNRTFPITALDVVLMGRLTPGKRFSPISGRDRKEALAVLDQMDMAEAAGTRIDELSGGQRQRVYIARALAARPKLLLLDEPTAGIDTKGQVDFFRLLKTLNQDITILMVSHDLLVVSTHVKSVACVNRRLHHHCQSEITGDMLEMMYPCTAEGTCPVELLAHGLPHRVLKDHET